jgi:hypothetical protein
MNSTFTPLLSKSVIDTLRELGIEAMQVSQNVRFFRRSYSKNELEELQNLANSRPLPYLSPTFRLERVGYEFCTDQSNVKDAWQLSFQGHSDIKWQCVDLTAPSRLASRLFAIDLEPIQSVIFQIYGTVPSENSLTAERVEIIFCESLSDVAIRTLRFRDSCIRLFRFPFFDKDCYNLGLSDVLLDESGRDTCKEDPAYANLISFLRSPPFDEFGPAWSNLLNSSDVSGIDHFELFAPFLELMFQLSSKRPVYQIMPDIKKPGAKSLWFVKFGTNELPQKIAYEQSRHTPARHDGVLLFN